MIDVLRNMARRKSRTGLTVLGIVIGVFALTVMGAMSEKINLISDGAGAYFSGYVTITQASSSGFGEGSPIDTARARELLRIPGVAAVVPIAELPLKTDGGGGLAFPDIVEGIGTNIAGHETFKVTAAEGTLPALTQRGVVAVGSSIACEFNLRVGATFKVRGRPFTVKAIMQTTMTAPDSMVRMNLRDAQDIFVAQLPPMLRGTVAPSRIATRLTVYPRAGLDADALAARIKRAAIVGIKVTSPSDTRKQFAQTSATFGLIVMGSALIALIVGALSVINTMAMGVAERVKEIGLKKAIGARTGQVLREFLFEAAAIGLLGGLIGLELGSLLVTAINQATAHTGTEIFTVTGRLAVGTVLFATILGAVAGFFPALRAARLNPVEALRAE